MRVGGQRHAPTALPPGKRPRTYSEWAHRAGLAVFGKSRPLQDSIPRPSSPLAVAIPTALSRKPLREISISTRHVELQRAMFSLSCFNGLRTVLCASGDSSHSCSLQPKHTCLTAFGTLPYQAACFLQELSGP
jgi:hypothetical protein